MIKCVEQNCNLILTSVNALHLHLNTAHKFDDITVYKCKVPQCLSDYNSWRKFRKHLISYHKFPANSVLKNRNQSHSNRRNRANLRASESDSDIEDVILSDDFLDEVSISKESINDKLHNCLLRYVAKFYADPTLPRSHVQIIMDDTAALFFNIISLLKPAIHFMCNETQSDGNITSNIFDLLDTVLKLFTNFNSEYKRMKALQATDHYIKPQPYIVGNIVGEKRVDGRIIKDILPVYGQFLPLRKILKAFFSLPGVFDIVYNYMVNLMEETDVFSNFVQGKLWRKKKTDYFSDKIVFPLFVYYDDFEVNNPLGSHKAIQKLSGTYITIPCIPPEYRSTLDEIFVTLLFHASDRAHFKNAAMFRILVDEINFLQDYGIVLHLPQGDQKVYFALGLLTGDNLGLNTILGYSMGFNATYYCRFCTTRREDCEKDCFVRKENLRNREKYFNDVDDGLSKSGLNEYSIWNEVKGFHVYENFASDPLLHEMAEGCLRYGMGHLLYHLIFKEKHFGIQELNERMKIFDYYKNGFSNRPPLVTDEEVKNKHLNMSGAEMINFFLTFGFLVGDIVPYDNKLWHFYTVLRQIFDIVAATNIQSEIPILLEQLISEHHTLYQELFTDKLKPKHHIMLHFPMMLEMSGPLALFSTMRQESKNRLNKIRANATYSRKNITLTIAFKESLQMCYKLVSQIGFIQKFEIGPGNTLDELPESENLDYSCIPAEFRATCIEVPWVNYKGTSYRIGACVVLGSDNFEFPIFGEIQRIYCREDFQVCLVCFTFKTIGFDAHLHAYDVEMSATISCINIDDLFNHFPAFSVKTNDGKYFISTRYAL